jgi:hypothetical protein
LAKQLGTSYFHVSPEQWSLWTTDERWSANQAFLDRAIAKGLPFILASSTRGLPPPSMYYKEISYLSSRGYTMSAGEELMLPPVKK